MRSNLPQSIATSMIHKIFFNFVYENAFPKVLLSLNFLTVKYYLSATPAGDINDPNMKWQIIQALAAPSTPTGTIAVGALSPPQVSSPTQSVGDPTSTGRRLRRVACTCPNCRDSEGRYM